MAVESRKIRTRRRHTRARKKVIGTTQRPRLAVYRSNKHISVQVINDENGKTLASTGSTTSELKGKISGWTVAGAEAVGKAIAEKAQEAGVKKVVYDGGGNIYHGRIKALADAARKAGLDF